MVAPCTPTHAASQTRTAHLSSAPSDDAHAARLGVDPQTPFGVPGGPLPALAVSDADLDAAYARCCAFYRNHALLLRQANAARITTHTRSGITIHTDGTLSIQGSGRKPYQVSDDGCTCMDYLVRRRPGNGICKHVMARELYRLAQAIVTNQTPESATNTTHLASLVLDRRGFLTEMTTTCVLTSTDVVLRIIGNGLLIAGEGHTGLLCGTDGNGHPDGRHATLLATAEVMESLSTLRATNDGTPIDIFIDRADGTLCLTSGDLSIPLSGTALMPMSAY